MSHFASKKIAIVLVALVVLAAIAAHVYLGKGSDQARGFLAILDHFFDLILALGLFTVVLACGNFISQKLKLRFNGVAEEISFSVFTGTGAVALLVLILGLLEMLRPLPIAMLLFVLIVASRRSFSRIYELANRSVLTLAHSRETRVVAVIYLLLIAFFMLRAATPPNAPDELIYHLSVTNDFVKHGAVYPMFDNSLGNFPFLIHMIYAIGKLAGCEIAARLFSLFLAVTTSFGIFGFCSRYLTRRVAVVAMFAFFAGGMVVEVAVTSRIDVSLAGMLFMCTYAMVNYLDSRERGWLWISALFAGFSLGIKHTAVIWLGLVGLMYLVQRLASNRDRVANVIQSAIVYASLALVVASPWYLKNYVWFHNPVYPLLTGEVAQFGPLGVRYFDKDNEQRLDAHFNTVRAKQPDLVKAQEQELTDASNARIDRHPLRWWEYFFEPRKYLMAEPYHYPNYLFLVIPFLIFVKRTRWLVWLLVLSLGFVFLVTWNSWIARYLVPAYPALTVVAAYTLVGLADRIKQQKLIIFVLAGALGVIVAIGLKSMMTFNSFSYLAGITSRRQTVARFTYYRPIEFINTQTPATARILVIGDQLSYGIERDYVGDESWFATKWRRLLVRNSSLAEVTEDLMRQGFTHVLYSPELFKFAVLMGTQGTGGMEMITSHQTSPEYQVLRNWSTFTAYQQQYLEPVYEDSNHFYVFKIK
jgi:4-amino-4-deoxy-L-arabinose transferase-like glycosyltransferase